MKSIKCYSVRLESLVRISDKAYKATSYDGSSDIIPASQVFGRDYEVSKSEAWWFSAWILKNIGMDADELLRLKQISGLAELFRNKEFTECGEEVDNG